MTECPSPSANTACVDRNRLTVVHGERPGGHGNFHMSSYCSFIQWFLSKGSKQIVIKADRTWPVIHHRASGKKKRSVLYDRVLLQKQPDEFQYHVSPFFYLWIN